MPYGRPFQTTAVIGGVVAGGTVGSVIFVGAGGVLAQDNANFFYDDANDQLQLNGVGAAAGIRIGADTQFYRSAANVLRTPDALTVDGILTPSALVDISGAGAGQIKFPAVQNPSADANTLDDYEKGTWTPVDSSGAGLAFTATAATYEKIGRQFLGRFYAAYPVTANGASAKIGGLPFTSANTTDNFQGFISVSDETTALRCPQTPGTTILDIRDSANNLLTNATMSANFLIGSACCYI